MEWKEFPEKRKEELGEEEELCMQVLVSLDSHSSATKKRKKKLEKTEKRQRPEGPNRENGEKKITGPECRSYESKNKASPS